MWGRIGKEGQDVFRGCGRGGKGGGGIEVNERGTPKGEILVGGVTSIRPDPARPNPIPAREGSGGRGRHDRGGR